MAVSSVQDTEPPDQLLTFVSIRKANSERLGFPKPPDLYAIAHCKLPRNLTDTAPHHYQRLHHLGHEEQEHLQKNGHYGNPGLILACAAYDIIWKRLPFSP